jgi:hypothetical protein
VRVIDCLWNIKVGNIFRDDEKREEEEIIFMLRGVERGGEKCKEIQLQS